MLPLTVKHINLADWSRVEIYVQVLWQLDKLRTLSAVIALIILMEVLLIIGQIDYANARVK